MDDRLDTSGVSVAEMSAEDIDAFLEEATAVTQAVNANPSDGEQPEAEPGTESAEAATDEVEGMADAPTDPEASPESGSDSDGADPAADDLAAAPASQADEPEGHSEGAGSSPESMFEKPAEKETVPVPPEGEGVSPQGCQTSSEETEAPATPKDNPDEQASAGALDEPVVSETPGEAPEPAAPQSHHRRNPALWLGRGIAWVGVQVLVLMDAPFAGIGGRTKTLLGYVGIATLIVAMATWMLG